MGGGGGGKGATAPMLEPVKSAEAAMREASNSAGRNQQLRRGLASTFSRSSMGGGAASPTPATAGTGKKLGA